MQDKSITYERWRGSDEVTGIVTFVPVAVLRGRGGSMCDDGHTSLRVLLQLLADEASTRFISCERLQAKHAPGSRFRRHHLRREALELLRESPLERSPLGIGSILGGESAELDAVHARYWRRGRREQGSRDGYRARPGRRRGRPRTGGDRSLSRRGGQSEVLRSNPCLLRPFAA